MLTVDFDRFPVEPGQRVLDLGCGAGRHAFALARRGADVVALDRDAKEIQGVAELFAAMRHEGEIPDGTKTVAMRGDAYALPFPDASFDRVVAAEILEHIPDDTRAMAELVRVLRPGGLAAITVPRWLPEQVCWALSDDYHTVEGGHVRIYRGHELAAKLGSAGLEPLDRHHAHGLHSPYWWLKCAVGVRNDDHVLPRLYHRLLVWDITHRPLVTRVAERVLNPLIGKSLVVYLRKPEAMRVAA
ncbi:MAG TPA: methyltransferase domain-containing protein [Mycobacteriales bacterium]|nr:methyltransferase domain-containing protein [Mycobacteriales bacterium]